MLGRSRQLPQFLNAFGLLQTAQLRVENSSLRKSLTSQTQLTKKFEEENKQLLMKLEKMTLDLEVKNGKFLPKPVATVDDCVSSQQTTCASSSEMVCFLTSSSFKRLTPPL